MSNQESWPLLRERFRSWTGNLLSRTRSTEAVEVLCEVAARKQMSPERFLDIAEGNPAERQVLIERLTIQTTWFMREPDAIVALASAFKQRAATTGSHRVTVWSVACATGEEPYTLAMALVDAGLEPIILATDISAEARAVGERGQYPRHRIVDLPPRWRHRFFIPGGADRVQVAPAIRGAVSFMEHNLVSSQRPPPGWAMFDAVVCRNVLLYFDRGEATRLLRELSLTCREGGYMLLSAAEHPIAWSIPTLGFEPASDTPLLRRRRRGDSSGLPLRGPTTPGASPANGLAPPAVRAMPAPAAAVAVGASSPGAAGYSKELKEASTVAGQGDLELAVTILKRIVERDALAAPAHLAMGLLWKKQGRLDEASSALRRARFLFGDDSWLAPYTLAVCLEGRGDWREALESYRHAAAVLEWGGPSGLADPDSNEQDFASTVLESCLRRMGNLQSRT
jgi:chemotaxis methyl-accepting protein methylase